MKDFIMVGGPAGVGKTTVCRELLRTMGRCAWLDADWCWMVHPWHPKTTEQQRTVERLFGQILDQYFADPQTDVVLFSWLMHGDFMFDLVTDTLTARDYRLWKFALVCEDREVYRRRLTYDGRRTEQVEGAETMERYRALHATVLNTSRLTPAQVAQAIQRQVTGGGR